MSIIYCQHCQKYIDTDYDTHDYCEDYDGDELYCDGCHDKNALHAPHCDIAN